MAKNLVLLRCGKATLHEAWLEGARRRNWDLALAPYQDIGLTQKPEWMLPVTPGLKWAGLVQALAGWQGWRAYDYIWLPDDDLAADALRINTLFGMAQAYGAALCAPALSPDSYFSHPIAVQNKSYIARAVSFVEVMMPCFRRDVLEQMLPLLAEGIAGDGWGLDFIWPKLLAYQDLYIFDAVTVRHTRPNGTGRSPEQAALQASEMNRLMAKYGVNILMKTISCYKPDGLVRYASLELFLIDYLRGYEHMHERNPEMFKRILPQQMG